MEILFLLLEQFGTVIAGIATVPILQLIKSTSVWIDNRHPLVKQTLAVFISFTLIQVGTKLDVLLPGDLSLFTGSDVETLAAAAIALAVHAGKKASSNNTGEAS